MRTIAFIVLTIWIFFANAEQNVGLIIHSVKVAAGAAERTAPVTIEYSYEGKAGELFAGASVGIGIDWESASYGSPQILQPGSHRAVTVYVSRPPLIEATRTERISVVAYNGRQSKILRRVFEQAIDWKCVTSLNNYGSFPINGAADAFDFGDYAEVDRIVTYWTATSRFDSNGDWKIDHFVLTLWWRFEQDRQGSLAKIREWRKAYPKSPAGALAEALYWIEYASYLRGHSGQSNRQDPDVMRVIRRYHAIAEKVLSESKSYAAEVPLWYELRLRMAIDGGRGERHIRGAFNDAIHAFPDYPAVYADMATHLIRDSESPRWREIIELADRLDEATRRDNPGAYAKLLVTVSDTVANSVADLFSTQIASWPRVRDSWKQLIERYPSPRNLNQYAAMSCQARDKESFETALEMIGVRLLPKEWPINMSVDICKNRFPPHN